MSSVIELAADAAVFMEEAGYSPGSRADYQRIWDKFEQYCTKHGVQDPDRAAGARFCGAVGMDGDGQWQVFYRRAVSGLFNVADTGRFALRAGRGKIAVPDVLVVEFDAYYSWLTGRGLADATVRVKTVMLRRFVVFLHEQGIEQLTALRIADVSAYVRSLAPLAASTRASQLYFLREYLRFAVDQRGVDPALGAMFPVIVTDRDAVLPSVYRTSEVAAALAQAGEGSAAGSRDRAVLLLAALLGLRSSDIKGLRFDQIDWANRLLADTARSL